MSFAKQKVKKVVNAAQRVWSGKFLPLIGRRAAAPAPEAEPNFVQSEIYAGGNAPPRPADGPPRSTEGSSTSNTRPPGTRPPPARPAAATPAPAATKPAAIPPKVNPTTLGWTDDLLQRRSDKVIAEVDATLRLLQTGRVSDKQLAQARDVRQDALRLHLTTSRMAGDAPADVAKATRKKVDELDQALADTTSGSSQDDAMRDAYLNATSAVNITNLDRPIADLIAKYGTDPRAMTALLDAAASAQIDEEFKAKDGEELSGDALSTAKGKLFRGNSGWSKAGVAYVKATDGGKGYLDTISQQIQTASKPFSEKLSAEVRPGNLKQALNLPKDAGESWSNDVTPAVKQHYDQRINAIIAVIGKVLTAVMAAPVPPEVSLPIGVTTMRLRDKGLGDAEVARMAGAFLILRVVNPALVTATANADPKGGPAYSDDQRRFATNVSKAVQSISNGITKLDAKEAYMQPLLNAVASFQDRLNQWFLSVADQGMQAAQAALGRPTTAPQSAPSSSTGAGSGKGKEKVD